MGIGFLHFWAIICNVDMNSFVQSLCLEMELVNHVVTLTDVLPYLFMYLLAIYIYMFGKMCLLILCPFLIVFFFIVLAV